MASIASHDAEHETYNLLSFEHQKSAKEKRRRKDYVVKEAYVRNALSKEEKSLEFLCASNLDSGPGRVAHQFFAMQLVFVSLVTVIERPM